MMVGGGMVDGGMVDGGMSDGGIGDGGTDDGGKVGGGMGDGGIIGDKGMVAGRVELDSYLVLMVSWELLGLSF